MPLRRARCASATAEARPLGLGSESRTIVQPLRPGGQTAGALTGGGGGGGATVVVGVVGCVIVGSGADCVCWTLDAPGDVATRVLSLALDWSASQIAEAAPATAAITRASSAGQIQSPGYQSNLRRQAEPSRPTMPLCDGRRAPHSRQYSCSSPYGVSQRGQRPACSPAT